MKKKLDTIAFCHLGISLVGLCLHTILTFITPKSAFFTWQKQLTGVIFEIICFLGIIAGLTPSKCSRIIHFKTQNKGSHNIKQTYRKETIFKGHHPVCGFFSSHIINFRNKIYCAGCTGLVVGAIASFIGGCIYFFADLNLGEAGIFIFWFGVVGVALGLFQYHLFVKKGITHFFLNVVFVLGAFLLLVGTTTITNNFFLEFYLLALIVYWIITRVALSQLEHKKICLNCGFKECTYI